MRTIAIKRMMRITITGMEALAALGETAGMLPVESVDSADSDVKMIFRKVTEFECVRVSFFLSFFFFFFLNRIGCQIISLHSIFSSESPISESARRTIRYLIRIVVGGCILVTSLPNESLHFVSRFRSPGLSYTFLIIFVVVMNWIFLQFIWPVAAIITREFRIDDRSLCLLSF